jgi:hypothetical protein
MPRFNLLHITVNLQQTSSDEEDIWVVERVEPDDMLESLVKVGDIYDFALENRLMVARYAWQGDSILVFRTFATRGEITRKIAKYRQIP